MLAALRCIVARDLKLAMRRRSEVLTSVVFFIIVVSLTPLGIGPEPELLRTIAPGVIWIAALLASMLTLPRLFASDHADGTLEQMLLSASPLGLIVVGKVIAHWLTSGVPLTLISPLLALQFDVRQDVSAVLTLSLLAGTPVLSFIGAIAGALTLGLRGGGVLVSVLVLPLYVPVLIIGAGAAGMTAANLDVAAHFMLLGALLIASAALAPWAISAALRISSE